MSTDRQILSPGVRKLIAVPLLALVMLISATPTSAAAVEVIEDGLPYAMYRASAVWTGEKVYIFGGNIQGAILDTIVEYDPETGSTDVTSWHLPSERMITSAVWTEEEAYVIGGVGYDNDPLPEIVRFVPGEGVELISNAIPWGTKGVGSVWTGEYIYVFGNSLSTTVGQYDVLRYDPVANDTTVLEDDLPVPGAGTSVIWTGDAAYIFGGKTEPNVLSDKIVKYVPGEGATVVEARLPSPRFHTTSAWDGTHAYILGGAAAKEDGSGSGLITEDLDEIVVFDPASGEVDVMSENLPVAMDARPSVWAEERVHQFGGNTREGPRSDIVLVDPSTANGDEDLVIDHPYNGVAAAVVVLIVIALLIFAVRGRRPREPFEGPHR